MKHLDYIFAAALWLVFAGILIHHQWAQPSTAASMPPQHIDCKEIGKQVNQTCWCNQCSCALPEDSGR